VLFCLDFDISQSVPLHFPSASSVLRNAAPEVDVDLGPRNGFLFFLYIKWGGRCTSWECRNVQTSQTPLFA
jgi:hypothetical protein